MSYHTEGCSGVTWGIDSERIICKGSASALFHSFHDSNLSSPVCLPNDGLLELKRKINDSQWIWTRWPVLQTIEFRKLFVGEKFKKIYFEDVRFTPALGTNKEIVKYLSQSNSFRDSLRLDKIVCCVAWHLTGIFTHLPNLPQNFGLIYGLTINPRNKMKWCRACKA